MSTLFVGGFVRDSLLGKNTTDIDMATRLMPDQVCSIIASYDLPVITVGIEHGTIRTICEDFQIDITHLRKDIKTDGRHAKIHYTDSWREDAMRRDFTINALYADIDGNVYDPTGVGKSDVFSGRIKFIGDPQERIQEDYLRILRYFRFLACYSKQPPDSETLNICKRNIGLLKKLSRERITEEFKLFMGAAVPTQTVSFALEAGLFSHLFQCPDTSWDVRNFKRFELIENKLILFVPHFRWIHNPWIRTFALAKHTAWEHVKQKLSFQFALTRSEQVFLKKLLECLNLLQKKPLKMTDNEKGNVRCYLYVYGLDVLLPSLMLIWVDNLEIGEDFWIQTMQFIINLPTPRFPLKSKILEENQLIFKGPELGIVLKQAKDWWLSKNCQPSLSDLIAYTKSGNKL